MEPTPSADRIEELLAHRDWVRRVARALILDENRAADLEQEVWLDALRAEPPRSPRAWLGTVLRRVAANLRRSEGRRAKHEKLVPIPSDPPDPAEWLARAEIIERVARAVRTLEEPYRTAVFLRYFEDLGPPAIAARLGVPVETVRTRLRRGLALLRERLDHGSDGDRRSWALLLLPLARRSAPAAAGAAVVAGATGVILMTLKTKVAAAAVLLLLFAGTALWIQPPDEEGAPAIFLPPQRGPIVAPSSPPLPPASTSGEPVADSVPALEAATHADSGVTVTGRILDDATGRPVHCAAVSLVFQLARLDPTKEPSALTGPDGRFRIEGIPPDRVGTDSLLVLSSAHAEAIHSVYGWHQRIRAGEPLDLGDFALEGGASVAGRVLDREGRPVRGAEVLFCRDTMVTSPPTFAPNLARSAATTDAEGRFSLERVPPARGSFRHTLFAVADSGFGWLLLPPVAGRKDLADLEIRPAPTASMEVTVRTPDGRPVEGARVVAVPHFPPLGTERYWPPVHDLHMGDARLRALFEGRTDSSGRLRLDSLPVDGEACTYDVVARAEGLDRGWFDGVKAGPGTTAQVTIDLGAPDAAVLSGVVRDAGGTPVAGAEVNFVGVRATTGEEGAYRVEGVNPAELDFDPWMTVDAAGFAKAMRVFRRPERWDGGGIDFVLERATPVKGVVVDEEGTPLAGAQVTLMTGKVGVETVHTGSDGRFSLRAGMGGSSRLSLYPPPPHLGWRVPEEVPVPADGSEMRVVLLRAPRGTRLVVEVRDAATGVPLDPTHAELVAVDGQSIPPVFGSAPRIEAGRAILERVLPADWILWVGAEGRAPSRTELRVEEGREEMTVTVRCGSPGTVRGRLEGAPPLLSRGMVFLSLSGVRSLPQWVKLQSDPGLIGAAHVEVDGTFRIEGVPPGRLRLRTEGAGFRGEIEVEVLAGLEVEAVLRVETTGRAVFRCAGPPPLPVAEVRLATGDGAWGRWTSFAGRDGRVPEWTTNATPGRVRWQARFRERGVESEEGAPAVAEGEFEAKGGEIVEVVIAVR